MDASTNLLHVSLSKETTSDFVPSRRESFIGQSMINIGKSACSGYVCYLSLRVAKHFNWIESSSKLSSSAYITAFVIERLVEEIINGIWTPLQQDHNWKIIRSLEGVFHKVDVAFCQKITTCGFKMRPVREVGHLEDQHLTPAERMRKIFDESIKIFVTQLVAFQTNVFILNKQQVFWIMDSSSALLLAIVRLALELSYRQPLLMDQRINQQREADYQVALFAKNHDYTLQETSEIDLRDFAHLSPLFLEKLLAKCPKLQVIQMNVADIGKIQGFNTQVHKQIKIELTPFSRNAQLLKQHSSFIESMFSKGINREHVVDFVDSKGKTRSVYAAIVAQQPFLKFGMYGNGFIDWRGNMRRVESENPKLKDFLTKWLDIYYTGQIPLSELNEEYWNLRNTTSMVGNKQYSDFTLSCKDGQSFPVHRILLLHSPYFYAQFESSLDDEPAGLKLDCSKWSQETVSRAIRYLYDEVIDYKLLDSNGFIPNEVSELLDLAREWRLEDLTISLEERILFDLKKRGALAKVSLENITQLAKEHNLYHLSEYCGVKLEKIEREECENQFLNEFKGDITESRVNSLLEIAKDEDYEKLKLKCLDYLHVDCKNDFTIQVQENELGANRVYLASRSPYFEKLLKDNSELKGFSLDCSEFDLEAVNRVLIFIKTGRLEFRAETYSQLLRVAVKWELEDLKNYLINEEKSLRLDLEAKLVARLNDKTLTEDEMIIIVGLAEGCPLEWVKSEVDQLSAEKSPFDSDE